MTESGVRWMVSARAAAELTSAERSGAGCTDHEGRDPRGYSWDHELRLSPRAAKSAAFPRAAAAPWIQP